MEIPLGVVLIHGVPGCGKSKLARRITFDWVRRYRIPAGIFDPARVWTYADVAHVSPAALPGDVWKLRKIAATDSQDPDYLAAFAKKGQSVGAGILNIDELRYYCTAHSAPDDLVYLARTWRHRRVGLVFVTQRINDLPSDVRSCVTLVLTGRCTTPRILSYLEDEYGLDPARVRALPPDHFIPSREGFE